MATGSVHMRSTPPARARPWIVWIGRVGFAAMGSVHLMVGILAAMSVVNMASAGGTTGALVQIVRLPFGQGLLIAVAIGLLCYALWRLVQALLDTSGEGTTVRGVAKRIGYAAIGMIYLALARSAVSLATGSGTTRGVSETSSTVWLLAQPFGQWLVGLTALAVATIGLVHFSMARTARVRRHLMLAEMSETVKRWGTWLGIVGFAARGVVFCIIGFFLAYAAWQSNAGEVRDFGGALATLEQQPYGVWLLGVVAIGLQCYGLFMLVEAKYRRMIEDY